LIKRRLRDILSAQSEGQIMDAKKKDEPEKEPYRFENGDLYVTPDKPTAPFVPDQGFDE
jgi:hypothetical protein